jgi:plasmid stability protein
MAVRNITLSLPGNLIRKAKVHAAQRNSTVNALVRKLLEEALSDDRRTRAAADRLALYRRFGSGSIWGFVGRAILPAAGFQPALAA